MNSLLKIFQIPDLRRKLFFMLGLLVVYRMGTFVTIPGIDSAQINRLISQIQSESEGIGRVMGLANMFSGGAISNAAVFSLGIMPYITASILFQILTSVFPELKKMQKEGESGRRKINQYTRYATLALCAFQGFMICKFLQSPIGGINLVSDPGPVFMLVGVVSLMAGTMIVMWLGEMITEFGIGQGISVIIMAGIVADLPKGIWSLFEQVEDSGGVSYMTIIFLVSFFFVMLVTIIYMTLGQRRIPIEQNRRSAMGKAWGGQKKYLPLRVNQAGVIPIIFAQSLIMFPALLGNIEMFSFMKDWFAPGQVVYTLLFVTLIVFFTFFYTALVFNPQEMAENMKQGGTFIPGIRQGNETQKELNDILTSITVVGATMLAIIAIIPQFLSNSFQVNHQLAGMFGGTGLLIVVGVALDLIQKIEGHMMSYNFDSLLQSTQFGKN
ncbi:MAG: preprotein translocase subunit SecY [Planctomycetes bacterium]|nr:preprotein translocase subunit SecY [Planctomycetota bacterium]